MKILLIEDDRYTGEMYKMQFEKQGHSITLAVDGEMGLSEALSQQFDCVLLDIMLPKKDGVSVLGTIRETEKAEKRIRTPVIMLTNLGQDDIYQKCLELGADGYIIKARNLPREIITKVEQILRTRGG